ncbi:hypothetical protein M5689_014140 [Euphorbia peplus]|nr:hypothetical protein M5689_014140 [Euphorbia peplus]
MKLKQKQDVSTIRQRGNGKNSSKDNQDVISNRQCDNMNNMPGTPESHSAQITTQTSAMAKSTDDCNLIPSQWQTHSCVRAVNWILRGSDNGEDVDPEINVSAQLVGCQSFLSSIAGNDKTANDSERHDVGSTNECATASLSAHGKYSINGYSLEAALIGLEYRIKDLRR